MPALTNPGGARRTDRDNGARELPRRTAAIEAATALAALSREVPSTRTSTGTCRQAEGLISAHLRDRRPSSPRLTWPSLSGRGGQPALGPRRHRRLLRPLLCRPRGLLDGVVEGRVVPITEALVSAGAADKTARACTGAAGSCRRFAALHPSGDRDRKGVNDVNERFLQYGVEAASHSSEITRWQRGSVDGRSPGPTGHWRNDDIGPRSGFGAEPPRAGQRRSRQQGRGGW